LVSVAQASAQAADTQHVYSEDQLTVAPLVLRQPPTEYPDSLKRRGIGGTVLVSVVLDAKGRPDSGSVRVVSTPDTALDGPARAVVTGTSFAPGRTEDRAVRARIVVNVEFDPAKAATAPEAIYGDDSLTEKPALLFGPAIDYPEDLRRNGVQGRVVIRAVLDTLGRIEPGSIQFLTTPHPGFLMSVSQYLAWARFRPARHNGRLVRSLVHMPVDFRLRGRPFPCQVSDDLHLKCPP
jgi:TonB family protein